jgi:hypothetical protein
MRVLDSAPPGAEMFALVERLFPICRSITGEGVRRTHEELRQLLPDLITHEVPSGTPAFDWIVPDEWNVHGAYIEGPGGNRIVSFADNNLHVVGYSEVTGVEKDDPWLSERRARDVASFLAGRGVAADHITLEGRGDAAPAAPPVEAPTLIAAGLATTPSGVREEPPAATAVAEAAPVSFRSVEVSVR